MVIGKDGGNGDRQTFGIGKPGDGRRRATAFKKEDVNMEFGVDIEYVGDGAERG